MRWHAGEPSRIWSFGCKAPKVGLELAEDQLKKAHDYRNTLVEIERNRRDACAQVIRAFSPELKGLQDEGEALKEKIEVLQAEIKHLRSEAR